MYQCEDRLPLLRKKQAKKENLESIAGALALFVGGYLFMVLLSVLQ